MQLLKYEQEQKPEVDKIKADNATAVIAQKVPKAKTLALPFVAKAVVVEQHVLEEEEMAPVTPTMKCVRDIDVQTSCTVCNSSQCNKVWVISQCRLYILIYITKNFKGAVVKLLKWFVLLMRLSIYIYIFFNKQHVNI